MTTFTDKELIKEIKERISSLDVRDDIERRAYEIALLSLEVEPDEREAYELFMEKRFGDLVDRRRAKNGDNEYMAWDMTLVGSSGSNELVSIFQQCHSKR